MLLKELVNVPNGDLESYLVDLVKELEVPESRYEAAERSYHSVGEWLGRDGSKLQGFDPAVYIQGSFRLGTAIRPINESDDYDVDLVCELGVDILSVTQEELKALFKDELAAYAKAHGMEAPSEGRRCVTLNYADGAQFHLDVLPAVPDGTRKVQALAMESLNTDWAETAIAITDQDHPRFRFKTAAWPHSNPKGFSNWFQHCMRKVFEARRQALALEARASVEDIPVHAVKTPLQAAIQIMKRHRDMMFKDRPEEKPISVIISTLAARAYGSDATISAALGTILNGMRGYIENREGVLWIANPTDPKENFADRWQAHPERQAAFFEWAEKARSDFADASSQHSRKLLVEATESWAGAAARRAGHQGKPPAASSWLATRINKAVTWAHRQKAPWQVYKSGSVAISCVATRRGFRPTDIPSNGLALAKGTDLRFIANTGVQPPFDVYWQITNTGDEAATANALRGDFSKGVVRDEIVHTETAAYRGPHSIECFIVKGGYLAASSGHFIVNVA
ncbi:nucleotidyltransferase [Pelomonas sp. HMWF004]|nr:nucleotidyltransferase [Pelomonas sp. HMWF004]